MQIDKIKKNVGNSVDGASITIKGYKIVGDEKGPKIYIQGGMHGGEVTIWILDKLFKYLENNIVSGQVTLIPIANPISWQQKIHYSTIGKFDWYDGRDWNRSFPGDVEGSLAQKIASSLTNLSKDCQFALDLHTSRSSIPFGIVFKEDYLKYSKTMGLEYTYLIDSSDETKSSYKKTFNGSLTHNFSVPNMAIECGSHDTYHKKNIDAVLNSILRLLNHMGVIKNKEKSDKESKYYTKYNTYRSPDGGFIKFNKHPGDKYKKGEVLYELINPGSLGTNKKAKAKENGIVIKITPTHIYRPGDQVIQSVSLDNLQTI